MTRGYRSQVPFDWKTRRRYLDLPFPESEYDSRLARIRSAMEEKDLDALVVFGDSGDPGDLVYLSNFMPFGRAVIVLPLSRPPSIATDAVLHGEPINSYAWMTWFREFTAVRHAPGALADAVLVSLRRVNARRVGTVGGENAPAAVWDALKRAPGLRWTGFSQEFTRIKSVRSAREVALLREVGRVTAAAMKDAVDSTVAGATESQVAALANATLLREGAHDRAFPTIVNSGPRSGIKHSYPTSRKMRRGDMVYLDMGAAKYGYQSDMSRTVVIGGANAEQRDVLTVIEDAFLELTGMLRPGVQTSKIVERAEVLARGSGLRRKYRNRIYLGLAVHHAIATSFFEVPSLGLPSTLLERNMSFAFEPMAHILDFGTAVIEDCILITRDGSDSLTPYERVHW